MGCGRGWQRVCRGEVGTLGLGFFSDRVSDLLGDLKAGVGVRGGGGCAYYVALNLGTPSSDTNLQG